VNVLGVYALLGVVVRPEGAFSLIRVCDLVAVGVVDHHIVSGFRLQPVAVCRTLSTDVHVACVALARSLCGFSPLVRSLFELRSFWGLRSLLLRSFFELYS
jgi:hypothetical protein